MNCDEVMEYMQRHLDNDLSEKEQNAMFAHLESCFSCKEMFERLNRLSDELVSLPKVTPPYSIVDSILPRLEALDRERSRAGSAGSRGSAAGNAKGRWKFPGMFGAVAAGACLIVAGTAGNMNGWFDRGQSNSAALFSAESAAGGSSTGAPGAASGAAAGAASGAMPGAVQMGGDAVAKRMAEESAGRFAPSVTMGGMATALPDGNASSSGGGAIGVMTGGTADAGAQGGGAMSFEGAGEIRSIEPAAPGEEGIGFMMAAPAPTDAAESDGTEGAYSASGVGAGMQAEPGYAVASPDGRYAASLVMEEAGAFRIVIVTAAGERVFESSGKRGGQLAWMRWSEDGSVLLYEVAGGTEEGVYEVSASGWTETKK